MTVEHLAPCKKLLRVEVDTETVDRAFEEVTKDFQRRANIPGFRPGKAPRHLIIKLLQPRIETEVKRKLINDHYRQALRQEKLSPVTAPDVEEVQFDRGQPLQFTATLETAPEFDLPDYKGLPVRREIAAVTEEDIENALHVLREQRVQYRDLARPVQEGDVVVVDYTGTCEGKPITEIAPAAESLTKQSGFWVFISPDSFIPGFAPQLIGANAGEGRTVSLKFPDDFVTKELAGKEGSFEVTVQQVKEKLLPEVDDAFAQALGAENVERLRDGVRSDLERELRYKVARSVHDQIISGLLSRTQFDLPESIVLSETRSVVQNIVRENQQRGVPKEAIDEKTNEIVNAATTSAKTRIKAAFLFGRIAEKEGITVDQQEIDEEVSDLSRRHNMSLEKMRKQLSDGDGLDQIREQIIHSKVLDFLELNAQIEEVLPARPR